MKIAVIGSGFSGANVANQLKHIADVKVFDKSRGFGGRMATRYNDKFQFDHGAQFFTAKSDEFKLFVSSLLERKLIALWDARFVNIVNGKLVNSSLWNEDFPHYVATPKMNSLCKALLEGVEVKHSRYVNSLVRINNKWKIITESEESNGEFDFVVFAIPPIQAKQIIPDHIKFNSILDKYKMLGCFSLMLGFDKELDIDWDVAHVSDPILSWISVNNSKPERINNFSLLVNSTNEWAEENIDEDLEKIKSSIVLKLSKLLGNQIKSFAHCDIQRWRYANIKKQNGPRSLVDYENNIALCGDWLIHARVESAYLSAVDVVNKIKTIL